MSDINRKELYSESKGTSHILPLLRTATVTPANGVDTLGNPVLIQVHVGTITDGTFTLEIQESDAQASGFTAVSDDDLVGPTTLEPAFTSSNDDQLHEVSYVGKKQYVRTVITASGSPSTGGTIGVTMLETKGRHQPMRDTQVP
jgi:hypothetical protein